MHSYSDALNEELKSTTLEKSFIRANEQAPQKKEVDFISFALLSNHEFLNHIETFAYQKIYLSIVL